MADDGAPSGSTSMVGVDLSKESSVNILRIIDERGFY
jgi:hypothetical protein